ncbi:hypothetical protein AURDEDRAFT_115319 [Auricularia subglabra TFB-10046 SS5]|nr:hypothetical protein AURDEDRAFT_115319 [Auricularia subglabra TFB-10046 SS5]
MRFSLVFLAVLPGAFAAATELTATGTAEKAANTVLPGKGTTPGNGTIVPLVDAVVKVTFDVSCGQEIQRIRPDCGGQCHAVSTGFGGLITNGNGVYGVNCQAYGDSGCGPASYLGETGNRVATSTHCYPFANARSYRCWYKC